MDYDYERVAELRRQLDEAENKIRRVRDLCNAGIYATPEAAAWARDVLSVLDTP